MTLDNGRGLDKEKTRGIMKLDSKMRQENKASHSKKIGLLKRYFQRESLVILAFLFGSRTKKMARGISDWDIGVYFKERDLRKENKIWSAVVDILGEEVDLVPLNDAPPILASRIIREGIPLAIKDRKFFWDYLFKITEQADYFLRFSQDYYQIYQKAKSLSETDKARLRKIVIFIENSLQEFEKFEKMRFEEYARNIEKRRNIERWLENLMNSILDVAKVILSSEKKALPDTYKKIVLETSLLFDLNQDIRERLSEWVELRNIIAHEYLEVLWERINDFVKNAKPYLEKFLEKTKNYLYV